MNRTSIVSLLITTIAYAHVATAATPAAEPDETRVAVRYGDLDLSQPADARTLLLRIERAAKATCGPAPMSLLNIQNQRLYDACVQGRMGRAVEQINAPMVTALFGRPQKPSRRAEL